MKRKGTKKNNGEPADKSGSGNGNDQPKPRSGIASGGNPGLTDIGRKALRAANRSEAEIAAADAAIRARGNRRWRPNYALPVLYVTIGKAAQSILEEEFDNKPLTSGNLYGTALTKRGLYPKGRGYHAVSDYLGGRGWNLPMVRWKGLPRWDISYIDADEAAKRKWEIELRAMPPEALVLLIAEIGD